MTDAPDPADAASPAIPLPEMPPRRTRGGLTKTRTAWIANGAATLLLCALLLKSFWTGLGVFLLLSTALVPFAAFAVSKRRRLVAIRQRSPDEPWLWDHEWDTTGVSVTALDRWCTAPPESFRVRALCALAACASIAAGASILWAYLLIFGLPWAWSAWRVNGAGTARLSYAKFPFHPGERVTLYLGMSEGGATFERAEFHLRRIRESAYSSPAPFGWGRAAFTTFVGTLRRPPGPLPGPELDVELSFDVPADAEGTRLSAREATYWVLDVVANTSAGPYVESFLVPIYERPAPAAESAA